MKNKVGIINRDITPDECPWLDETVAKGTTVIRFDKYTYGCIADGIAVTKDVLGDYPFFEVPRDSVDWSA